MRIESFRRPLWVAGAVIVAAALFATGLYQFKGWGRMPTPAVLADTLSGLERAKAVALRRPADDAVIWRRLGGRAAVALVRAAAPRADFGLEVIATFYEADQQFCGAVLRDRARRQYLVKVGESVQGYQVARISAEGVALNQGGAELFVKLPKPSALAVAEAPAVDVPLQAAQARVASAPAPVPLQTASDAAQDPSEPNVVSRAQLQYYVRRVGSILAQGQLVPEMDKSGQVVGLRIERLDENAVAAFRGLKQGDVVREVYSKPITNPIQIPIVAHQVWAENPPTVTVLLNRDGKEQQLVYQIQ